ncbi:chromate transporter-domain-containing protein [Cladochytrium replicatum]|nr:chromate transporter-domain-containing protein [Cladochytrium replicatum]
MKVRMSDRPPASTKPTTLAGKFWETTRTYAPLSVLTFGGTQTHIAIFLDLFVEKYRWIDQKAFAELFAIANSLPGPTSTKIGYAISLIRNGGILLAVWSFLVWSLPGGVIMGGVGIGISSLSGALPAWVRALRDGLVSAAVALVALAAYRLGASLLKDRTTHIINLISFGLSINYYKQPWLFPSLMVFGGLTTYTMSYVEPAFQTWKARREARKAERDIMIKVTKEVDQLLDTEEGEARTEIAGDACPQDSDEIIPAETQTHTSSAPIEPQSSSLDEDENQYSIRISIFVGILFFALWIVLLVGAILLRTLTPSSSPWNVLGTFYFTGSIIFGGGPVVVPLLQSYVVGNSWLTVSEFLIGYAIINILPGPMFNFAAFCGALALRSSAGYSILGAFLAWIGIFAPGIIIQTAVLPMWSRYRSLRTAQIVFKGVNAAAAGLVFSATYLLSQTAIDAKPLGNYPLYVVVTAVCFVAVGFLKMPAPVAIVVGGVVGIFEWLANGMPV